MNRLFFKGEASVNYKTLNSLAARQGVCDADCHFGEVRYVMIVVEKLDGIHWYDVMSKAQWDSADPQ